MVIDLLTYLTKQLVEKPEVVKINQVTKDQKIIIELFVDHQDLKRVIGKEGRNIRALRSLVNCFEPFDKELVLDSVS